MVHLSSKLKIKKWKLLVSQASELQYYNIYKHRNNLTLKNERQKLDNEWESSLSVVMMICESPSKINLSKLVSIASSRPRCAANVSTSMAVNGKGIRWDRESITWPSSFLIFTPIPAQFSNWKRRDLNLKEYQNVSTNWVTKIWA